MRITADRSALSRAILCRVRHSIQWDSVCDRIEQAVRLLICIGELGVAESCRRPREFTAHKSARNFVRRIAATRLGNIPNFLRGKRQFLRTRSATADRAAYPIPVPIDGRGRSRLNDRQHSSAR